MLQMLVPVLLVARNLREQWDVKNALLHQQQHAESILLDGIVSASTSNLQKQNVVNLTRWYERLGNNLVQLVFASQAAFKHQSKLVLPRRHSFLEMENVTLATAAGKVARPGQYSIESQFYPGASSSAGPAWSQWNATFARTVLQKHIMPAIPKPRKNALQDPISEDTLVVHLRNGDVFQVCCNCCASAYN